MQNSQSNGSTVNNIQKNTQWLIDWESVDLKVLLSILTLAEPSLTQTRLAQMLKISPVTLSRLVNSEDHRIREAWIPTLSDCLSSVDLDKINSTTNALLRIKAQINKLHFLTEICPSLDAYSSKQGQGYEIDPLYWGLSDGIIRLYNPKVGGQWLIALGSPSDRTNWRLSRSGLGPFARYRRMQSITQNDKLSILYTDAYSFSQSILGLNHYQQMINHHHLPYHLPNRPVLPCTCSLLLYSQERKSIEEEYIISFENDLQNPDSDYNY